MSFAREPGAGEVPDDDYGQRIAAGDRAAEAAFLRAYEHSVRVLVRRHCRPGDAAVDDLAQDVLLSVLEKLRAGAVRDTRALPAYVQATIARMTAAEYRKRKKTEALAALDDVPAPDNPEKPLAADQLRAHIATLLAELPKVRDRQLLTRFYLQDHDRDDVCRALAIDVSHFHRVVFRARERLRALLVGAGLED